MTINKPLKTIGLLGGGVIGGGWAARFVLNGYDVKIYDVDPQAKRKIGEVMANARRAYAKLTLAPLPIEGKITFVETPEDAVTDVDFVQYPQWRSLAKRCLAYQRDDRPSIDDVLSILNDIPT